MSENKNNWGGKREGAGRKPKENKEKTYVIFFRLNENDNNLLKEYALKNYTTAGLIAKKIVLDKIKIRD